MDAQHDNAIPLRAGMRRLIPPWEYRHLRAFASARIAAGIVLAVCGVLTLVFGGAGGRTYGWAALFLGGGGAGMRGRLLGADHRPLRISQNLSLRGNSTGE